MSSDAMKATTRRQLMMLVLMPVKRKQEVVYYHARVSPVQVSQKVLYHGNSLYHNTVIVLNIQLRNAFNTTLYNKKHLPHKKTLELKTRFKAAKLTFFQN